MIARKLGRTLNDRQLNAAIHPYRFLDNTRNLVCIVRDYAVLAVTLTAAIYVCHRASEWGLSWFVVVPVVAVALFIVGACQHRLAGLGHEGSHYILLKNRVWGELVSDVFCMFPLFGTTEHYRQVHLGHHEYTNDWERDPELLNLGKTRRMSEFPMRPWQFMRFFGLSMFWLPTLFRYSLENLVYSALGNGLHPYPHAEDEHVRREPKWWRVRATTMAGIIYIAALIVVLDILVYNAGLAAILTGAALMWLAACLAVVLIPERYFFRSRIRPVYSNKVTSVLRLGWFTCLATTFSVAKYHTGFEWQLYFYLFWAVPLLTVFPYLMLMRDLFQHANADDGRLTNSRVLFCNPLVRWAMFVYGQDYHLTHHLYPAVPHYNLPRLHTMLRDSNAEYADHVVECDGVFWRRHEDRPSMLEVMHVPTREPE